MRISIFGLGYVGAVSSACFADLGNEVVGVDLNESKVDSIAGGRSPIIETGVDDLLQKAIDAGRLSATTDGAAAIARTDVSFISVGTPSGKTGMPNLDALKGVTQEIGAAIKAKDTAHAVVVRSTIPPGTTEDLVLPGLVEASGRDIGNGLSVCFNPEFLREGSAVKDFFKPPMIIVGAAGNEDYEVFDALHAPIDAPIHHTSCRTAESVKYFCNAYHALKIAFANEAGSLAQAMGADGKEVMRLFCEDTQLNISKAYLRPGFAFGGSCLPKDLRAVDALAKTHAVDLPMMSQVIASNNSHIDRAFDLITEEGRKRIALFGLSFKPGTDDLRESPYVVLAERLIGKGYELSIYDAALQLSRLVGANKAFIEREIPHLDRILVDAPEDALTNAETIVVGHAPPAAIEAIAQAAGDKRIIDLEGVETLRSLEEANYTGLCW